MNISTLLHVGFQLLGAKSLIYPPPRYWMSTVCRHFDLLDLYQLLKRVLQA